MSPTAPHVPLDDLLAHRRWVRALAHSLVADPHGADDVEQQVWLATLQNPPKRAGNLRAWLARIVRRRRIDQIRREHRRAAREANTPPSAPTLSPDTVVSQAETQARVAAAVLELDEPYRTTILLRYFQERSAREIAALQGVPVETVRTRVGRGLGMLRGRLEREMGRGPTGWQAALLPVAGLVTAPKVAGGVGAALSGMNAIPVGAALLLLVVSAGLLLPRLLDSGTEERIAGLEGSRQDAMGGEDLARLAAPRLRGAPDAAPEAPVAPPSAVDGADTRLRADEPETDVPTSSDLVFEAVHHGAPVPPGVVAGTVRDEEKRPLALAEIQLTVALDGHVVARVATDRDGTFRFENLEDRAYLLEARDGHQVMPPVSIRPGRRALEITLRSGTTIAGRVVEAGTGEALPDVLVTAVQGTGGAGARRTGARTDGEGRFAFRDLDAGPWSLVAGAQGSKHAFFEDRFVATPLGLVEAGTWDLHIELRRGLVIEGVVQGPDGEPWTTGAWVRVLPLDETGLANSAGRRHLQCALDGTFRTAGLTRGRYDLTVEPMVVEEGTASGSLAYVPGVAAGTTGLVVNLVVGRCLNGRLVDEQGTPVTEQGQILVSPAGRPTGGAGSLRARLLGDGRFTTTPLDPGTTWDVCTRGFAGYGSVRLRGVTIDLDGLEIVLPRGLGIAGRIVDAQGQPVPAGVPVVVRLSGHRTTSDPRQPWEFAHVHTDAEGRFHASGLRELTYTISAGGSTSGYVGLQRLRATAPVEDLVLTVERGVPLSGRLVDARGEGVAFATLSARGIRGPIAEPLTTTRPDGSFAFAGVPRGRLRITMNLDGQSLELGMVEAPARDVLLTVSE